MQGKNLRQPLGAPSRTPRELQKLRNFAIFANLFGRGYPKNLELLFRDVEAKGCLELLYQLKEKEKVRGIEKENADRIEHPLEEGTPLFQRGFEEFLFLSKRILPDSTGQKKTHPR